ncbi:unnamed protein product [Pleuronectes platessa]|uniref:Uncharacterized protein n=1 Tax=Pleuronectes platessa TaxID=8262 RepID=A0A9N7V792_PLEPL|nr:unnamed protein product [Pleuronectes platessa]
MERSLHHCGGHHGHWLRTLMTKRQSKVLENSRVLWQPDVNMARKSVVCQPVLGSIPSPSLNQQRLQSCQLLSSSTGILQWSPWPLFFYCNHRENGVKSQWAAAFMKSLSPSSVSLWALAVCPVIQEPVTARLSQVEQASLSPATPSLSCSSSPSGVLDVKEQQLPSGLPPARLMGSGLEVLTLMQTSSLSCSLPQSSLKAAVEERRTGTDSVVSEEVVPQRPGPERESSLRRGSTDSRVMV